MSACTLARPSHLRRTAPRITALIVCLLAGILGTSWMAGIGDGVAPVGAIGVSPTPYVERALLADLPVPGASVSTALSGDGSTAVVGYGLGSSAPPRVRVYATSGAAYRQIGATLTEPSGPDPSNDTFGESVAVSNDGSTVVVGNSFSGSASRTGAAYVYTKSGNAYVELGGAPIALGDATYVTFGYKVAISGDGATVLVVARDAISHQPGAVLIYTKSGGVYSRQQVIPAAPYAYGTTTTRFALSTDGTTLVIGNNSTGSGAGNAVVYVRSGGTYSQFGGALTASDPLSGFGGQVALSGDGATLAITAFSSTLNPQQRVVYVFTKGVSSYSQSQEIAAGPFDFPAVALDGDGTTLAVGITHDTAQDTTALTPTIDVYRKGGATYALFENGLIGFPSSPFSFYGRQVALSTNGAALLAGSGADGANATAVFTNAPIAGVGAVRGANWNLANALATTPNADLTFASTSGHAETPLLCDWSGTNAKQPGLFSAYGWLIGGLKYHIDFGQAGDIPLCGDWTGQGRQTIGVYRSGVFYLKNSNTSGNTADIAVAFGQAGDIPVVGDWTGQGKQTVGVYRGGVFYLLNNNISSATADIVVGFGQSGDVPVAGDWTGGGIESIGVFRNGSWYLRNTNTTGAADTFFLFGMTGDVPLVRSERANGVSGPGIQPRVAPTATAVKATATATHTAVTANPGKGTVTPNPLPPKR